MSRRLRLPVLLITIFVVVAVAIFIASQSSTTKTQPSSTRNKTALAYCERSTKAGDVNHSSGNSVIAIAYFRSSLTSQQRSDFEFFDLIPKMSYCFVSLANIRSGAKSELVVHGSIGELNAYAGAISIYLKSSGEFSLVETR